MPADVVRQVLVVSSLILCQAFGSSRAVSCKKGHALHACPTDSRVPLLYRVDPAPAVCHSSHVSSVFLRLSAYGLEKKCSQFFASAAVPPEPNRLQAKHAYEACSSNADVR